MTNTPDKSELLPCPFCGAKLVGTIEQGFGHSSDSPDCILQYGWVDSHDIERWNTRSRPPADQVPVTPAQVEVAQDWIDNGFPVPNCTERVAIRAAIAALQAVPAMGEVGELLLHGTLSMTKRQVIVDFADREMAEVFFEALERVAQASGEE